ncbi:MAG: copper resistance protein [Rhodospirillaceae bacterium]|nr:copper resistance protein [Rhodospirillaceae bacterium]
MILVAENLVRTGIRQALRVCVLAAAAATLAGVQAKGAGSPWFEHEHGAVRLIASGNTAGSGDRIDLGLQFRMKPGWKIYWRSPGDAGFPPSINWVGSRNFSGATMQWPAPERFSVLDLETLGYKKEVVLPISAGVFEPGKAVVLKARVRFLTCDDICVPYEANLALALPAGPDVNTPETGTIDAWRKKVPVIGDNGPLRVDRAEVAGEGTGQALIIGIAAKSALKSPDVFVEGPADYGFGKPVVQVASTGTNALMRITVEPAKRPNRKLAGETVTLTVVDGDRAIERKVLLSRAVATAPGMAAPDAMTYGFFAILGLAILGGLILNLMPCVLPVLSIKLLTVVSHGGGAPGHVRAGFLASAAGILACFLLLGTVAVTLQSAGMAAGWGIQFQQPAFLTFMIAVITLFACNMWGLFEIRLPGAVSDTAASAVEGQGLGGHFLTGVFTTLLATPCTAPFLGTAVGFSLSRGPFEIYAVFLALGIGLALPWIVVAAFPALVNRLPKPGHWMITLKRILSIALIGTAFWLFSVLWFQIGSGASAMIALLMGASVFTVWQNRHLTERSRFATWIVVGLLTAISMVGAGSMAGRGGDRIAGEEKDIWRPFDIAVVRAEVRRGNTVLVDVTANWCLTCQVNKSLVLNRGRVAEILDGGNVIAMKADWSKPDPEIADYLRGFGRFGIPFNVVYGPTAPNGVPLPEILTESSVLAAIEKAGGKAALAAR